MEERQRQAALQVAAANKLLTRIENLERQVTAFHVESSEDGRVLGIDVEGLVVLLVDRQPILDVKIKAEERSATAKRLLDAEVEGSVAAQRQEISSEVEAKCQQLDEPNRRYQGYRQQLAEWQTRRDEIAGSVDDSTSVAGLEARLVALTNIPAQLSQLNVKRNGLVRDIFATKQQLLDAYRKMYLPVQQFIDQHPISKRHGALQFFASMAVDGLVDGLLNMIHQGRRGSFQGEPEGRNRLRDLVLASDFSAEAGVFSFLASVGEHLVSDKRDGGDKPVRLSDQLLQDVSVQDIYNFLYGLSYLKPRFELRWQGKPLDQLSPGERGNLLLVFYLLIDKRDVPLIVDQPEENLDNQTIATMLVPAIKEAKERRQIIIVTHNPNLAVVCDADQVIYAQIDKTDGNRVTYTTGAIENPEMTKLIVDVLEGTKPAFDLRDAKYEILEHLA